MRVAQEVGGGEADFLEERDDAIAPKTVFSPPSESEVTTPSIAKTPTSFEKDTTTLDARITRLESKLAENQRDLYTLLGKIREITRLQKDATKNNRTKNTEPNDVSSDEQQVPKPQSRKIALTLAIVTGVTLGASFFFASDFIDQHLLHLRTWAMQFVDFISDIVR